MDVKQKNQRKWLYLVRFHQ